MLIIEKSHRILLIDNYDSFSYNLVEILRKFQQIEIVIKYNNDIEILNDNYDAVIISPGPGLPIESGLLLEAIRRHCKNVPIFGICLGLQAIVEHYGGSLNQLSKVFHGIKDRIQILDENPIFTKLPKEIFAGRYHSWVANKDMLPSQIQVTAIDSLGEIMAIQIPEDNCFAVQFHPESYMTDMGFTIMKNFLALALKEKTQIL